MVLYRPTVFLDKGLRLRKYPLTNKGIQLKSIQGRPANGIHVMFDTGANAMSLPVSVYDLLGYVGTLKLEMPDGQVYGFPYNKFNKWNAQVDSYQRPLIVIGVTNMVGYGVGIEQTAHDGQFVTIQH
tara:strand:- start:375 stop:755 length:381 start_codon:yes stop_codon:yes gene_type:complete